MSLQIEQPGAGWSLGEACWGGSWETGAIPKGAGCFSLHLASGMEMAYSFPQSNKKLQRLKHELRWVLVRLFWLFTHFKTCMPYFSLGPPGCSCLIRLEGLQFEITCVAWCSISLYDFGNTEDYHGFICKEIRTAVSILVSIILAFLALIEFCYHLVLST